MRLTWEERHSLAYNIIEQLESIYKEVNKKELDEIEEYKRHILKDMPYATKLLSLLDRVVEVERELKELSAKYVQIKDEAIDVLVDVEGIQYVYPEVYAIRYAIFDSEMFRTYINLILKDKIKKVYGDIFFKRDKLKKQVVSTLYKLEKEYTDTPLLVNRVLFELGDLRFNINNDNKIKDNKDEQQ
jgi:hypothetical protein